jgi:hypothetical protein
MATSEIEYANSFGHVAQQCIEVGHRIEDDIRRRMDFLADRTLILMTALRRAARRDATYSGPLHDLESLRPPKRRPRKVANATGAQPADASTPATDAAASAPAAQPATVVVVHGDSGASGSASSNGAAHAATPVNGSSASNGHGGGTPT